MRDARDYTNLFFVVRMMFMFLVLMLTESQYTTLSIVDYGMTYFFFVLLLFLSFLLLLFLLLLLLLLLFLLLLLLLVVVLL